MASEITDTALLAKKQAQQIEKPWYQIDPRTSTFMSVWDSVTGMALIFTALVTPFEVAFLEAATSPLEPLFIVNRGVDLIFIFDIILNFLLVYQENAGPEGTQWVEEPRLIVCHYMKGWFVLDIISILPFDLASLKDPDEDPDAESSSSDLSVLKLVRIIRLLRLIKLVRLVRGARILKRWESKLAINYSTLTLWQCLIGLLLSAHWFACVWAMQVSLAHETPVDSWMGYYGYCWDVGKSAATSLERVVVDGPGAADFECAEPGMRYSASVYFAVMTITSIGYGDITPRPQLASEQIMATLLMLVASMLWAYIIGTFCGMIATMNPAQANFRNTIDDLNRFMELQDLAPEMRQRLREYFHETKHLQIAMANRKLLSKMSPALAGEVAVQTSEKYIKRIWYLKGVDSGFMAQLAMRLEPMVFAPSELVPVGKMYICHRGIALYGGKIMTAGRVWGEDMILESLHLIKAYSARAMNYLESYSISKDDLLSVAANFPGMLLHIRACAIKLSFIREVIRLAKVMKERENPGAARVKADAFSGSLDSASTACILTGKSSADLSASLPPPFTGEAKKKTGGRGTEGVFDESSGRGRTNANQKMEAAEAREAYEGLDMGGSKWGKDKDKGKAGAASASDPALCARVDKLVSEQHNLVSEVSDLRGSIALIEQLLRQALPLSGAAAPQGRVALQPRRHSAAGGSEASTRQLLAAAAGTSAAGGVPPPLQAAALPPARPLNNLEA